MATIPTCTIDSFTNNSQVTVIIPNSDDFYNQLTSDANWKDRIDNNAVVIVRHEWLNKNAENFFSAFEVSILLCA